MQSSTAPSQLVIRLQSSRYRAPSSPFLISLPSPPHTAVHRSDVRHTAPPCHGPSSFSAIPRRRVTDFLYSWRYFRIFVRWINQNGHSSSWFSVYFPTFFSMFVRSRLFAHGLNYYAIYADQITDLCLSFVFFFAGFVWVSGVRLCFRPLIFFNSNWVFYFIVTVYWVCCLK